MGERRGWDVVLWSIAGPPSCCIHRHLAGSLGTASRKVGPYLGTNQHFFEQATIPRQQHRIFDAFTFEPMEYFSLKRSIVADRGQANLSSKVYVRSTKSGKVQKIVRELYLRQDIPCSSNLCRKCLEIAPTDYSKRGGLVDSMCKVRANSEQLLHLFFQTRQLDRRTFLMDSI